MSPFLRRTRVTPGYRAAVADVLGSRHRHHDPLAVYWAHEIGWRTEGSGDEMVALAYTAHRYGVEMQDVIAERGRPRPPLLPATRSRHRGRALPAIQSLAAENIS